MGMVLCGAVCGVVFDVFRAVRRCKKSGRSVIAAQDLLFWVIELVIVYMAAFELNYAHVRAYEGIALVIGSVMYFMTLSQYTVRLVCAIIRFAAKTVRVISAPVIKLAVFMMKPVKALVHFAGKKASKAKLMIKMRLRNITDKVRSSLNSIFAHAKAKPEEKTEG